VAFCICHEWKSHCRYNVYERYFLRIKAGDNCTYGITCVGRVCISVLCSRLIGVGDGCVFRSGTCVSELNIVGNFKERVVFSTVLLGCKYVVVLVLLDIKLC
jgi:acetyltransferase-like isoleucine patch superfamily enzyme